MRFEDVQLEHRPCPLECSPDDEVVFVGRDRLQGLPGKYRVVRCQSCGLLRTDPRPTPATMSFYYPDSYGPYVGTRVETEPSPLEVKGRRLLRRIVRRLGRATLAPPLKPGRLLEIGCASGSFLHDMAYDGWESEGIEFSESAAQGARALGYKVHAGQLETAPDPTGPYDLVAGWMVLEHLHEPVAALRKLRAWTRPGGRLAVSTPNVDAYAATFFGDAWMAWHLPNHLYHYSPRTMAAVLRKSGWTLERIFHQRVLTDPIISTGFVLQDRDVLPRLANRLAHFPKPGSHWHYALFPASYVASLFGQTSRMTIWARPS